MSLEYQLLMVPIEPVRIWQDGKWINLESAAKNRIIAVTIPEGSPLPEEVK